MTRHDEHAALTSQIRREVGAVALALETLIDAPGTAHTAVCDQAPQWAAALLGADDAAATRAGRALAAVLGVDHPDPAWWATPLGQAIVRTFGHPSAEVVGYPVAGAMLGITRQGVHKHRRAGKLAAGPGGDGVTVASIQALLRARRTPRP